MPFSKMDLARGTILGIIVGVLLGYFARTGELEGMKTRISNLESQVGQLRKFAPSLRTLAEKCGIYIGAAVEPDYLTMDYAETLKREFNMVTTENVLKFGPVHPQPTVYSFAGADRVIEFAEAHGMKVRGHTLVWHSQLPSWITAGRYTRDEWIQILRDHIMTVVGRYRGRIYAWDVVNEAIDDSGALRNTIWLQNIGPEYIELAFRWAHEADPNALLFYNDYGAEGLGVKSDAVYNLVKGLLEKGVPIHGVGLQMHISADSPPSPQSVAANIRRLNNLGLEVHIT
ncbi:MAG: endo-1,4-beta-xylanase, partial [Nitrososphaerota archaeon]|nr:endo-1,4-beta-xylanase [Nitrososphaerota archaeon]